MHLTLEKKIIKMNKYLDWFLCLHPTYLYAKMLGLFENKDILNSGSDKK